MSAINGTPGFMESQDEQTLARGRAPRPEAAWTTEAMRERMIEMKGRAMVSAGGTVGTRAAGQLV
jgi:hypothetical protein